MADERDVLIAELRRMNEQLGALLAQQQSVMAAQRQLISELEQRLIEQDAAHTARAAELEAEVRRLERDLFATRISTSRAHESVGRAAKSYLFVAHPRVGRNIAGLYSLVGSCITNRVEPTEYLSDVLPRIADAESDAELDALLPNQWVPSPSGVREPIAEPP